jgi:UDP-N-acetylglucosamine 4-epimerase
VYINGDGETARDFCYIDNVVQMNLLAGLSANTEALNLAYNVALGDQTSLNQLYEMLRTLVTARVPGLGEPKPTYRDFRQGDVRYSRADISRAERLLGYSPQWKVREGLEKALDWYVAKLSSASLGSDAKGRVLSV